ncbi:single-stranded DNA-binding protein, partial [Intestinimonas sp.]|uniref:single-stranded DNA-binding protein n=1 Tax=Intestinimonas sp. TaxID=1965293 RepID=UPI003AB555E6
QPSFGNSDIIGNRLSVHIQDGDYLPCIAWGALAQSCGQLSVGDPLRLEGRLQSRTYQKLVDGVPQDRTAFEVSIMQLAEF